jgi:hypothetical protein
MRDYSRTNEIEEDSDALMTQMKDMLEGNLPSRAPAKGVSQKLPKGTNLALALVHSMRGRMRGIGGLDAPEELVLETKIGKRAAPIVQKPKNEVHVVKAEPAPIVEPEPEIKPTPEPESMPGLEPEPGPEPELEPEPLEPETDFASVATRTVEPVKVAEPKILLAGDDEDDEGDEGDEEGEEEEEEDEEEARIRKPGKSKKLLLRLLRRMARKRSKRRTLARKTGIRSRSASKTARSAPRRRK